MKRVATWFFALAIASQSLAAVKTRVIEYKQGDTTLEGLLAWDDSSTAKRPAVIVVHEWWGNNEYSRQRAEQLAQLGYVGFAIDMYGKGNVTTEVAKATEWSNAIKNDMKLGLARLQAGMDTLKAQSMVDPNKIAAIGYCFGGTCVLQMARNDMPVVGVVSFHGAIAPMPGQTTGTVKSKILVCHGAADPFVPQTDVTAFMDEMTKAGADWQLIQYSGAVHAFTNPQVGKYNLQGAAYNKSADMRSWQAMKDFLHEILGQ